MPAIVLREEFGVANQDLPSQWCSSGGMQPHAHFSHIIFSSLTNS